MVRRYGFIRGKVSDALLNVDPDAPVDPRESLRRQRLFGRVFSVSASDLESLGAPNRIEMVGTVVASRAVALQVLSLPSKEPGYSTSSVLNRDRPTAAAGVSAK